jgi:hypothetical protein
MHLDADPPAYRVKYERNCMKVSQLMTTMLGRSILSPAIRPMGTSAHGHPTLMSRVWVAIFAHG